MIAPEENGAALRQQTALDARAQLLSATPADASKPIAPVPAVVDTTSAPANGAATLVPAAPIPAQSTIDQLTPDHAAPRSVDVGSLLAASSLDLAASFSRTSGPSHPGPRREPLEVDGNSDWGSADRAGARLAGRIAAGQPVP